MTRDYVDAIFHDYHDHEQQILAEKSGISRRCLTGASSAAIFSASRLKASFITFFI